MFTKCTRVNIIMSGVNGIESTQVYFPVYSPRTPAYILHVNNRSGSREFIYVCTDAE